MRSEEGEVWVYLRDWLRTCRKIEGLNRLKVLVGLWLAREEGDLPCSHGLVREDPELWGEVWEGLGGKIVPIGFRVREGTLCGYRGFE